MRDCLAVKEYLVNASARAGGLMNPAHYERPGFYKGSVSGLIGHEAVAPWPAYTQWMDSSWSWDSWSGAPAAT